jgi:hypothetical protein
MVREALGNFRDDPAKQAAIAEERVSSFLKGIHRMLRESGLFQDPPQPTVAPHEQIFSLDNELKSAEPPPEHVKRTLDEVAHDAKLDFVRQTEEARNRVNQNELILLVALFEVQMKDIHREILLQEPSLLNTDRQISLGRMIAEGSEAVIQLEIDREVQLLDRKRPDERARYFHQRLRLNWLNQMPQVQRVLDTRNRLLHENSGMTVGDDELKEARSVALGIPFECTRQCVERYPTVFTQWEGWLKDHAADS